MTPIDELLRLQDWLYEVLWQNRGESIEFRRRAIEEVYLEVSQVVERYRLPVSPAVTPDPSKQTGPGAGGTRGL